MQHKIICACAEPHLWAGAGARAGPATPEVRRSPTPNTSPHRVACEGGEATPTQLSSGDWPAPVAPWSHGTADAASPCRAAERTAPPPLSPDPLPSEHDVQSYLLAHSESKELGTERDWQMEDAGSEQHASPAQDTEQRAHRRSATSLSPDQRASASWTAKDGRLPATLRAAESLRDSLDGRASLDAVARLSGALAAVVARMALPAEAPGLVRCVTLVLHHLHTTDMCSPQCVQLMRRCAYSRSKANMWQSTTC